MQAAELGARLQAELGHHQLVTVAVEGQRVGPAAQPVQREHQHRAHAFAELVRGQERRELGDHVAASSEDEIRVGFGFQPEHAPLGELLGRTPDQGRLHVGERRTAQSASAAANSSDAAAGCPAADASPARVVSVSNSARSRSTAARRNM